MGSSVTIPCANGDQSQELKEIEKVGEISESSQGYITNRVLRCDGCRGGGVQGPREHRTAVRRVQPRQGREGSG